MPDRHKTRATIARLAGIPVPHICHYANVVFTKSNGFHITACCENALLLVNPLVLEQSNGNDRTRVDDTPITLSASEESGSERENDASGDDSEDSSSGSAT